VLWRAALGLIAAAVVAWFAVGIVQSHDEQRAEAIVSTLRLLSPAQASRARGLLDDANLLNPDFADLGIVRAQLQLGQGRRAAAQRTLASVVRREPENIAAWDLLASAAPAGSATHRSALAHVYELAPPVRAP
jgi:predicted Zn-dependent protease